MTRQASRRSLALAAGVVSLSVLAQGTTAAEVLEQDTFHGTYGPEISYCGEPFTQEGVTDGRFQVVSHGADGPAYYMESATFTDTWTNTLTGESLTWSGRYTARDQKLTTHDDGTMTELIQITGTDVMRAEDGSVLGRTGGMFRFELTFDENGDFVSRVDVSNAGLDFPFCQTLEEAIG